MWIWDWPKTIAKWMIRQDADPLVLFNDALGMILLVAVSALATLAYGL